MKFVFLGRTVFEGTEDEVKGFRDKLSRMLVLFEKEIRRTCSKRPDDTSEDYFNSLTERNRTVYDCLCTFRELAGEFFVEYLFLEPTLTGTAMKVYKDLETKETKIYTLGYFYLMLAHRINVAALRTEA